MKLLVSKNQKQMSSPIDSVKHPLHAHPNTSAFLKSTPKPGRNDDDIHCRCIPCRRNESSSNLVWIYVHSSAESEDEKEAPKHEDDEVVSSPCIPCLQYSKAAARNVTASSCIYSGVTVEEASNCTLSQLAEKIFFKEAREKLGKRCVKLSDIVKSSVKSSIKKDSVRSELTAELADQSFFIGEIGGTFKPDFLDLASVMSKLLIHLEFNLNPHAKQSHSKTKLTQKSSNPNQITIQLKNLNSECVLKSMSGIYYRAVKCCQIAVGDCVKDCFTEIDGKYIMDCKMQDFADFVLDRFSGSENMVLKLEFIRKRVEVTFSISSSFDSWQSMGLEVQVFWAVAWFR